MKKTWKYCSNIIHKLLLLAILAAAAASQPAAAASWQLDRISVIAEPGVAEQFADDIEKASFHAEKFYKERYGLTLDNPVKVVITPTKEAYAAARMREGGESPKKAQRHAQVASGNSFGSKHIIVLNGGHSKMATDSQKRVKTMIHELTHQVQAQLSGNKQSNGGYQWLSEGSANALAFRVMENAGFSTVVQERERWLQELKDSPQLPSVAQVTNRDEWLGLMESKMNGYGLATVMTEFLIDKCGYDKLIAYFRLLKTNTREDAFQQAFGLTHDDFAKDFNEYYQREVPNAPKI